MAGNLAEVIDRSGAFPRIQFKKSGEFGIGALPHFLPNCSPGNSIFEDLAGLARGDGPYTISEEESPKN